MFVDKSIPVVRWDLYSSLRIWLPEVRDELRAGLKARNAVDLDGSERYPTRSFLFFSTFVASHLRT